MLPPVGVPGGDQSAAGGVGASGGAAAGLCRDLRQRQAAQDHPREHRSRRDLFGTPAARPVQRHRHRWAVGSAVGVRLEVGAAEPCAGGAGFLIMATMTGKRMAEKMRQYGNALEAMSMRPWSTSGYPGGQDLRAVGIFLQKVQGHH